MGILRNNNLQRWIIRVLLLTIISIVFIILFSYSSSFLYPDYYECDQSEFMTIGKMWALGRLPYVEQFDHKGPIIFWVNMIGMAISGSNRGGVALVQIIFMIFTLLAFYKILSIESNDYRYRWIATIVCLIALKLNFCRGNTVEEYCLPFLGLSTYGIIKWFKNKKDSHEWQWALFYGITFGVCLFTRLTNIAPIAGFVFIICIYLIVKKNFINLIQNAAAFIAGALIVTVPFMMYFASHDALYDMWYGTLLHNIYYFNGAEPWIITYGTGILGQFFKTYFAYYCIILLILSRLIDKDYWTAAAYFVTGILETYVFFGGFIVTHYPLVCIFQITLLINEIHIMWSSELRRKRIFLIICFLCLVTHVGYNCVYSDLFLIKYYKATYSVRTTRPYERLVEEIPEDELDSFVAFGRDGLAEAYIITDTLPCSKYGLIQDWYASFSDKVRDEIRNDYSNDGPQWILSDQGTVVIDDILATEYEYIDSEGVYVLWHKL